MEKLHILWTTKDREVALNMLTMYAFNAKKNGWWKEVNLIIWGPSAKLVSEDYEVQEQIKAMRETGVTIEACKACSDRYGVSDVLSKMNIEVRYMGEPLTQYIKSNEKVITL